MSVTTKKPVVQAGLSAKAIKELHDANWTAEHGIVVHHDPKYSTSEKWYTGGGEVFTGDQDQSFDVKATFNVTVQVKVTKDVFNPTNHELEQVYRSHGRCVAILEENLEPLYGDKLRAYFEAHKIPVEVFLCRAMEGDKTPETVHRLIGFLGKDGCDVSRNEPVLVIGGGVLHDTAGLACALQNRRTPFVMIPTTVVSAVDAGPSPRTCTNGRQFKNSLGAYHPPILTLVDRTFFRTLPKGLVRNGIAEIIKMGCVDDLELFELLEKWGPQMLESHFATLPGTEHLAEVADEIVYKAVFSYMKHEGTNMFETFQDRPHAYGHTWSPCFEPAAKLLHGHAVCVGMGFGAALAELMGWLKPEDKDRIIGLMRSVGLAVHHPIIENFDMMAAGQKSCMRKRGGRGLWAPLPTGIGSCDYAKDVSLDLLKKSIECHRDYCAKFPNKGAGTDQYLADLGLE